MKREECFEFLSTYGLRETLLPHEKGRRKKFKVRSKEGLSSAIIKDSLHSRGRKEFHLIQWLYHFWEYIHLILKELEWVSSPQLNKDYHLIDWLYYFWEYYVHAQKSIRIRPRRRRSSHLIPLSTDCNEDHPKPFILLTFDSENPPKPLNILNSFQRDNRNPLLSLLREVTRNGFTKDLSPINHSDEFLGNIKAYLLAMSDDDPSPTSEEVPLLSVVWDKMKCETHVKMGKPLKAHHMADFFSIW